MDNDVFIPQKPIFYRWFVDDIINRRKKNITDELFFKLNRYHQNIKLTTEISPTNFLDTQLVKFKWKDRNKSLQKTKQITRSFVSKHP